jgi:hypothetical protein
MDAVVNAVLSGGSAAHGERMIDCRVAVKRDVHGEIFLGSTGK